MEEAEEEDEEETPKGLQATQLQGKGESKATPLLPQPTTSATLTRPGKA